MFITEESLIFNQDEIYIVMCVCINKDIIINFRGDLELGSIELVLVRESTCNCIISVLQSINTINSISSRQKIFQEDNNVLACTREHHILIEGQCFSCAPLTRRFLPEQRARRLTLQENI